MISAGGTDGLMGDGTDFAPVGPPSIAPLRGLRILDLTRLFPFACGTQLLLDLGAEVVKVEAPGGEIGRDALLYAASNRGKRSVEIDLRTGEGRASLLGLVPSADVIVESFRPGYLDSLGLGYDALRALRPSIVVCSVTGYAHDSALRSTPGHDLNYLGFSGAVLPDPSYPPVVPALPVIDMATGIHLAYCVAAALLGVARGGPGCHLQLPMTDLALSMGVSTATMASRPADRATVPFPELLLAQLPMYRLWRTRDDRWISLCNIEPKFWQQFLEVIARPDLAADQLSVGERGAWVIAELEALLASRTADEWAEAFAGREVCFAPLLSPAEAMAHPDPGGRGLIRQLGGPTEVLFPATIDGVRPSRPEVLVAPGADNDLLGPDRQEQGAG
jgi:alpha-methylacyl-CoA racemase